MSIQALFWTLLLIELTFAGLDLAERHANRDTLYGGDRLRKEGVAFFLGIAALFTLIQYGALALAPRIDELIPSLRSHLQAGTGATEDALSPVTILALSIALFYFAGLWDYPFHRFASHTRWLWFSHENHHLPNQIFVGMPGLFSRPFVVVSVLPVVGITVASSYLLAMLAGLPLWDWTLFQFPLLAASVVLTGSHSSFLRRSPRIHQILRLAALTTPQEHVLHHTVDLKGNFGNFTTLWDRVFGTYLDPLKAENQGHECGLPYDQDFVGTLTFGQLKIPHRWRERFQIHRYCNIVRPENASGSRPS